MKYSLICILIILSYSFFGQGSTVFIDEHTDIYFQEELELYLENADEAIDFSEVIERITDLLISPIDINQASISTLSLIPFLNIQQVHNIYAYRQKYGAILSIYELIAINGIDEQLLILISPLIIINPEPIDLKISPGNMIRYGHHEVLLRAQRILQKKDGYSISDSTDFIDHLNNYYLGDPNVLLLKYRFKYKDVLSFGWTAQKDAGELFLYQSLHDSAFEYLDHAPGRFFDFNSFHFCYKHKGFIRTIVAGDYHAQFGQGINMWSGFSFGKSSSLTTLQKFGRGIKATSSSNESQFLRGVGVTFYQHPVEISLFYSKAISDANIIIQDSVKFISTLYTTGLHRTVNELNRRKNAFINTYGTNTEISIGNLRAGITIAYHRFNDSLLQSKLLPFDSLTTQIEQINGGIHYQYNYNKINIYGESGIDKNLNFAHIHGINFFIHPRFTLSLNYRNYATHYDNLFANSLCENTQVTNESGFLGGFLFEISKKTTLSGFIDTFKFPWLKYGMDTPSYGKEASMSVFQNVNDHIRLMFRYRIKNKWKHCDNDDTYLNEFQQDIKNTFHFQCNYSVHPSWQFKSRIDYAFYAGHKTRTGEGILFIQDIKWNSSLLPFEIIFRYALFDTDSFDERIYAYEPDVLYAFSIPAYYYQGSKSILMGKWNINKSITIWLRYSHLFFSNQQQISSGTELINGPEKSEIKLQLRIKI